MPDDLAGRIRAARAIADQNQLPFAKLTSIGKKRLAELESGAGDPPTENELLLISTHAKLPMEFFTVSWSDLSAPVSADELFSVLDEIRDQTSQISEGMTMLRGLVSEDTIRKMFPDLSEGS
jgi:transcriptional regulator with XRE-family HTH domain